MSQSPREALLAKSSKGNTGVTPVPCPDCPVPGVFAARMSAARYLLFLDALRPFASADADTPEQAARKRADRVGVQVRFAAVDADGNPLLHTHAEALALDAEVALPLVDLFVEINGLGEKKSPPPNSPPAG